MENQYVPELGQMFYGQPSQTYEVDELTEGVISSIRVLWEEWFKQDGFDSPFENSAQRWDSDVFSVHAYSWNDKVEQEFNFKWRDFKLSWYKYFGRGMSCNKILTQKERVQMLKECQEEIVKHSKANLS